MENIKIIIKIIITVFIIIVVAGMYKFNYLANKKGYDVDGNNITQSEKISYLEKRSVDLEKDGIRIIDSEDEFGDRIKETLYLGTSDKNPLKDVSLLARRLWYSEFIGMDKGGIMEKYESFRDSDFENTGELKEQFDFDILLNNLLKRVGLQPHNGEHIESLINDLKYDNITSDTDEVEMMTIRIPNLEWSDDVGDFVVKYKEYSVKKTPKILDAVYKKLFELNSYNGKYEGLIFNSVSIDKNKTAKIILSGSWFPGGDMSQLFFRKNIDEAAFQFDTVDMVTVYVDGKLFDWCIDDESDGEGGCNESAQYWIDKK